AVVFATTTLAQGLNYSFKTVIFESWGRWNSARRQHEPIPLSDFHNIAGRAGRLGKMNGRHGRVIFFARDQREQAAGSLYLSADTQSQLRGQIDPGRLDQIVLQLLASGIVHNQAELVRFVQSTLSAHIAGLSSTFQDEVWASRVGAAISTLS